ncbi:MAG: hypothetical protein MJB12_09350 [Firmicutes bacterium]|nr:hypothetical protein [Bacillota bacterium]
MDKSKFDAVFSIISAALVEKIATELNLSYKEAITELYSSQLYQILEREETKLWQYSTEKLFETQISLKPGRCRREYTPIGDILYRHEISTGGLGVCKYRVEYEVRIFFVGRWDKV